MNSRETLIPLSICAALTMAGLWLAFRQPSPSRVEGRVRAPLNPVPVTLNPLPSKPSDLATFVAAHKADKDPQIQDRVGAARIRLAYDDARTKNWEGARALLLTAAHEYKGTGKSGTFGGISDQARYQAAACLMAEGKKAEARKELLAFMTDLPLSPLVRAARRRLTMLDGGNASPAYDRLLQADIAKQEADAKLKAAMCGPMCIAHLLPALTPLLPGSLVPSAEQIAKLCGTSAAGTSLAQMRAGLKQLGCQSFAFELNRRDLLRAPLPAILLLGDHYVVLEKIGQPGTLNPEPGAPPKSPEPRVPSNEPRLTIYDPFTDRSTQQDLPEDDAFSVPAILFSQPEIVQ